jgi:hypothetical protein
VVLADDGRGVAQGRYDTKAECYFNGRTESPAKHFGYSCVRLRTEDLGLEGILVFVIADARDRDQVFLHEITTR